MLAQHKIKQNIVCIFSKILAQKTLIITNILMQSPQIGFFHSEEKKGKKKDRDTVQSINIVLC